MGQIKQCLLIDDDIDDQEIFQTALAEVDPNIKFAVANNGAEGLNFLTTHKSFVPDFIFLDLNMPKMNGLQCLPEIKKLAHLKRSKVVIYSTSLDAATIETGKDLGADDFLVKPSRLAILKTKLSEILDK